MAKQGQHKHDDNDGNVSRGHNNPDKSVPITTGTPKKKETYEEQAHAHKATNKQAQESKPEWVEDTRDTVTHEADSQKRQHEPAGRTGSQSNEGSKH